MAKSTIEVEIVNKVKGIRTCSVCGREFPLISEEHYVARDVEKKGVIPALNGQNEAVRYDAFDCPHCGCQNVIQERKQEIRPCDFGICDGCEGDEEDEEEDHPEPDGCVGCKYEYCSADEEPCSKCKNRYMNRFEREGNSNE